MTDRPVRLLVLDNERKPDFRRDPSRYSGLYQALEACGFEIVHVATPRLRPLEDVLDKAFNVAPTRERWRNRAGLSGFVFRRRTAAAQRILDEHAGRFDVVLQVYTLFAAGRPPRAPTALYLDSTLALSRRFYPPAVPVSSMRLRAWTRLETEAYRSAEALLPMSRFVADSLIEDYGCDPARIEVVGAGANIVVEDLAARSWERPVALHVGLAWERKGMPELMEAWARVRAVVPDAELWLAGTPPRAELPTGVSYVGRLGKDELEPLYRQARAFVLPSRWDPFPGVLREAMGYGVTCVATRQAGVPEIVADGRTGLVVEPRDPVALADALTTLLGDAALAERLGRAAHAEVLSEMTWEAVAQRMAPRLWAAARR